jgi:hypothetical protein
MSKNKAFTLARYLGFEHHIETCPCQHLTDILTRNVIVSAAATDERSEAQLDQELTAVKARLKAKNIYLYTSEEAVAQGIVPNPI